MSLREYSIEPRRHERISSLSYCTRIQRITCRSWRDRCMSDDFIFWPTQALAGLLGRSRQRSVIRSGVTHNVFASDTEMKEVLIC
jgi:hypothetical protein